jgi:DNA-binding FadR family transcriptional regulator
VTGTTSARIYEDLRSRILEGDLSELPSERRLAEDLGASRHAVREALKRLQQAGLIRISQGGATRVRDWRRHGGLDVIAHVLFRAGGVDQQTLASLLEARRLMLQEAARLAAERRSGRQARRLEELAERFAAAGDEAAAQAVDFAFMTELVEASGNVVFVLILNSIRQLYFERAELFEAVVSDHDELAPLYRRAAAAVRAGAPPRAASAVGRLATLQAERLG